MWLVLLFVVLIIVYFIWENITVEKTYYDIKIPHLHPSLKGTKIIHLSDFHFPSNRVNMKKLVTDIKNEEPDLICLTGDIFHANSNRDTLNQVRYIGQSLKDVAPIYAVSGNHDYPYLKDEKWQVTLENNHINVLCDEAEWVPIGEDGLVLMGLEETEEMSDFSVVPDNRTFMENIKLDDEKKDKPVILLAHHPEYFEQYLLDGGHSIDLVLSGHAHGGQIRLPFIGGVYAPGQGINPKYDYGYFASEKEPAKRLIINRGLTSPAHTFRMFNRPEVGIITLQ